MKKLLLLSIIIIGCSPQKQLAKLMRNHPEMFKSHDSLVIRHDTLITKEYKKDSVIHNILSKDTVFIKENHLIVKYLYKGGDSAYIAGIMEPYKIPKKDTTIYKETTVIKEVKAPKTAWENFCDISIILILIVVIGKYVGMPLAKAFFPKLPL